MEIGKQVKVVGIAKGSARDSLQLESPHPTCPQSSVLPSTANRRYPTFNKYPPSRMNRKVEIEKSSKTFFVQTNVVRF